MVEEEEAHGPDIAASSVDGNGGERIPKKGDLFTSKNV